MRSFFACSVGEPGKNYDEQNMKRVIDNKAFILHKDNIQKGVYEKIKPGDILLLKYRNNFVAFAESLGKKISSDPEWNITAPVVEWHFKDSKNLSAGVETYGIQLNTLEGAGQMGTVKEIQEKFALEKLESIDSSSQLYKTIISEINNRKTMENNKAISSLLLYKKQIILQGPPGTGKTFNAQEIAKLIVESSEGGEILNEDIIEFIIPGIYIKTPTDYNTYKIIDVKGNSIKIEPKGSSNTYNVPFAQVIQCYQTKDWENPSKVASSSGQATYILGIAKYIFQQKNKHKIKLVQFHPAYSYEDFVRGITVKSKGDSIEYKSENKTLGKFALTALKNYIDSKKAPDTLSEEQWIENMFEDYKDSIEETLNKDGKYKIPGAAHIYEIDETAFKYTGDHWGTKFRMPFSDLLKLYRLGISERKQIKHHSEISGRAKQHATYYFNLLQDFRQFLSGKDYTPAPDNKVLEQKYVLIIDEINRANLPAVLGELIYALEYRGKSVESIYDIEGDYSLVLPPNLYIIGTMNTADRSVGHIDYAIRRRFAFVDIEPSYNVITQVVPEANGLREKALKLFADVSSFFTNEKMASDFKAKDIQLGHSYFLAQTEDELSLKLQFEIKPLLKEYIKDGILISVKDLKGIDLTELEIDQLKIN